jgi:hypothetical protein
MKIRLKKHESCIRIHVMRGIHYIGIIPLCQPVPVMTSEYADGWTCWMAPPHGRGFVAPREY